MLFVVCCLLCVVAVCRLMWCCYVLFVVCVRGSLFVVCCVLFVSCCLLFVVCCSVFAVCSLWFVVCC